MKREMGDSTVFAASQIQQQLWLIHALQPESSAYHVAAQFQLDGSFDPDALKQGIEAVIREHDILRTTFFEEAGEVRARISSVFPPSVFVQNFEDLSGDAQSAAAERYVQQELERPFDLEKGPLLRAGILRLSPTKHRLLICLHQIITDAESVQVLAAEIARHYNKNGADSSASIRALESSYFEYSSAQQEWLLGPDAATASQQWKENLDTFQGLLNMRTDHHRPSSQKFHGKQLPFRLSPELSAGVQQYAKTHSVSIKSVLLSAYVALLYKYSGQEDIVVGVPVSDRPLPEFEGTLGCFFNILPIGVMLDGGTSVVELFEKVSRQIEFANRFRRLPFKEIVALTASKHLPGANPIFQVGFAVEPTVNLQLAGVASSPIPIDRHGAQLDLFLVFSSVGEKVEGVFEFDTALFEEKTISQMLRHYQAIVDRCIASSKTSVSDISCFDDGELDELIYRKNNTENQLPKGLCLHQLFERWSFETPDAVAVTFAGEDITYQALNESANRLANVIRDLDAKENAFVGINLERSIEMIVAVLAVQKTGAAYVPLDPAFPEERLKYIISDSALSILITEKNRFEELEGKAITRVLLDRDKKKIEGTSSDPIPPNPDTDRFAYVLYTSGSTGTPKGIPIHHRAAVNFMISMAKTPGINRNDSLLAVTTLSFDISILEIYLPLSVGARIILAEQEVVANGEKLLEMIRTANPTIMQATPSTWEILSASGLTEKRNLKILCGGEPLTERLAEKLCRISDDVWNMYGPTETTIWSTCSEVRPNEPVTIGRPIDNTQIYIVDSKMNLTPPGVPGELLIGGEGVSFGYRNRPELTDEKFISDPFSKIPNNRVFKTGDLACYRLDGALEHLGRIDNQIKLRGFRIELGEIENALAKLSGVQQCAVTLYERDESDKRLVAYVTMPAGSKIDARNAREFLRSSLPDYMIPSLFEQLDVMPMTANGKIDRKQLPAPSIDMGPKTKDRLPPAKATERVVLSIWESLLGTHGIGTDDNFFDVGGSSLLAVKVSAELKKELRRDVPVVEVFQYPTVEKLAAHLDGNIGDTTMLDDAFRRARRFRRGRFTGEPLKDGVAVVGMSGRFPGAPDLETLWKNLCNGVESISTFSRDELDPFIDEVVRNDPDYIPSRGIIEDADKFDAKFFDIGPMEAKLMDPQQRVFLEVSWAALENAGYTSKFPGMIGVFAGVGDNFYYPNNVLSHPELVNTVGKTIVGYGNEKDYIATRVSYALNLTGPGVSASTGCSATLLAVDNAFKALLDFECDMAIAGGIDITVPQKSGQMYTDGGTFTRDGHCKPFDADASGTMFCDGAGAVVLRRLEDAVAAGDTIYAVIRGSAKNNDGANKVSFLAPSVDGQAQVITMAQAQADVHPDEIQLIEAHGTGTPLGDPIEVQGITKAFRFRTSKKQYCYIGSIKGNIGHPTNAAGVAGFIKACLCLHHEKIPKNLHYRKPNPKIDFENSPFKVVTELTPWQRGEKPRIAGVSSFGFGGTNVHTILEEAPLLPASGPSRPMQLVLFSAKNEAARNRQQENFRKFFGENPSVNLADAAFTLQTGRQHFQWKEYLVCESPEDAAAVLSKGTGIGKRKTEKQSNDVVFMFPGQGAQYVNMGLNLYRDEPIFKHWVDRCCDILNSHLDRDLRELLFPKSGDEKTAYDSLKNTYYTQPAIFTLEYSLAKLWMSWGIEPVAMIGHSIGEFVCACLSGVFVLEDVLGLVALRGSLMRDLPRGSMLSVRCSAAAVESRLPANIQLAASNGPELCVVAGPTDAVNDFATKLEKEGLVSNHLHTSHAFHSAMMEPIVSPYVEAVAKVDRREPKLPFLSTCTGEWITKEEATSAEYWGKHLRMPVRFSEAISKLLESSDNLFLEVGPRNVLTTLARQHAEPKQRVRIVPSLGGSPDDNEEWRTLLSAIGELWLNGKEINWDLFYGDENRRRIPLPSYAFDRKRFWVDPIRRLGDGENEVQSAWRDEEPAEAVVADAEAAGSEKGIHEVVAERLIRILESISGMDPSEIGDDVSFIELGFDSLLLTQFSAQILTSFGKKISFRQISRDYSTVSLLAGYLISELGLDSSSTPKESSAQQEVAFASTQQQETCTIPMTEPQREIWLSCQVSSEASCAYNDSFTLNFSGDFDVDVFRKAVDKTVQRHDALRTAVSDDGKNLIVSNQNGTEFRLVELNDKEDMDERVNALVEENATTPFDLEGGGLLRVIVVRKDKDVRCILSAHHIICDGWSIDVVLKDLAIFYSAIKRGEAIELSSAYQFSSYALESTSAQRKKEEELALNFWKSKFTTEPPPLELASDFPRPLTRTYESSREIIEISQSVFDRIKAKSVAENCSVFSILMSGLFILLHKYSRQDDIVIGVPVAGQPMQGLRDLVGHCVSFLPVRKRISTAEKLDSFYQGLQLELMDIYDNFQCTYGSLLTNISVTRDASRPPLVSVLLTNSAAYRKDELTFEGVDTQYVMNGRKYETFDLYFNTREDNGKLSVACQFNTNLYTSGTIARYLRTFEQILFMLGEDESIPVSQMNLLDETDRRILSKLNDTTADYPRDKRIHELFESQVTRSDAKVAVNFGDETVTYSELNRRANQLSHHLFSHNVAGKMVGICLPREIDMVVGVLAILKSGAAYVPLDPSFPKERLAYMAADSGLDTVIVNRETETVLDTKELGCVHLDDDREKISACDDTNPTVPDAGPSNLAYVIYTSGSTGKPKGIELEHRSVVNFLTSMAKKPGMSSADKVLGITTMSFDISVLEIFLPLTLGASIVLLSKEQSLDTGAISDALHKFDVTVMQATPATWRMLTISDWKGKPNLKALCGGEAVTSELADALHARVGELWNVYGPTETTVWSTCKRLRKDDPFIAIGPPIDNTQVYVLDEQLQQVPIGVTGELFIGGDGLARGYHDRPELTAERFIPNPFDAGNTRLYRTGDLAKITTDGELLCLGRTDFQVKIRGYRVELGEIENALLQHESVKECAVIVFERTAGDQRLIAYVRKSTTSDPDPADLKQFVGRELPGYMVPSHFEWVDSFPLTGSGKIDRKKLPEPVFEVVSPSKTQCANETEGRILQIWRSLLGIDHIELHSSFFDVGGHSLLVIELIRKIKEKFGKKLSVAVIFENPSIVKLAEILAGDNAESIRNHDMGAKSRAEMRKKARQARTRR